MSGLAAQLLNGVQYGLLLFLISSGLTLIFGVMGIINLAHGSLFMIGAYVAFAVTAWAGSLWLALPVAVGAGLVLGGLLERVLFRRFYDREHLDQVVLVVCLAVAAAMFLLLERTRLGSAVRAAAEKPEMVDLLGLDARRIHVAVFAAGTALATLAGALAAPLQSVYPGMGNAFLIISFVVVVVGGVGSVAGAFWGALLVGVVDTLAKAYLPLASGLAVYAIMAGILLWRPSGLFAPAVRRA